MRSAATFEVAKRYKIHRSFCFVSFSKFQVTNLLVTFPDFLSDNHDSRGTLAVLLGVGSFSTNLWQIRRSLKIIDSINNIDGWPVHRRRIWRRHAYGGIVSRLGRRGVRATVCRPKERVSSFQNT